MVFKPFTHLPRQIFSKTFAHGYAQSVVAASQSSYASTTTSLGLNTNYPVGKLSRTAQLQNAYQGASSSSGPGAAKAGHASSGGVAGNDGGLAAYYSAWQHAQQTGDDSEWRNHQLQKRIGWKGPGNSIARRDSSVAADSLRAPRPALLRTHSADAVHDLRKSQGDEDATVDAETTAVDDVEVFEIEPRAQDREATTSSATNGGLIAAIPADGVSTSSAASDLTFSPDLSSSTSVSELSQSSSEHIVQLAKSQRYAEIPGMFQSSLSEGLVPTIDAYNALLIAAINIPTDADQAFTKVLDVQADMIRRGVKSNGDTHAIMVQFLADRALQTIASRTALEGNQRRYGGMAGPQSFLLQSNELEFELLGEDESLYLAMKQFRTGTSKFPSHAFPAEVYDSLIRACAQAHLVDDMCDVYNIMNRHQQLLNAETFSLMIEAFQPSSNLGQAVQAYENYKDLAQAENHAFASSRNALTDHKAYAALIKVYITAGQAARGLSFYDQIIGSLNEVVKDRSTLLSQMQSVVVPEGIVAGYTSIEAYPQALQWLEKAELQIGVKDSALSRLCIDAADGDKMQAATEAFESLSARAKIMPAPAMLAMSIRQGDIPSAKAYWSHVSASGSIDRSLLQPITIYAVSLIANSMITEGLSEARTTFARMRQTTVSVPALSKVNDEIAEAFLKIDQTIMNMKVLPTAQDSIILLNAMMENGTFIPSIAEHALAPIGPNDIHGLGFPDVKLLVSVQATMMLRHMMVGDNGYAPRFACLLEALMRFGKELDAATVSTIQEALPGIAAIRPDLTAAFEAFLRPPPPVTPVTVPFRPVISVQSSSPAENFDPYAHNTDFRGSTIIADQLENANGRGDTHLNDALTRFKNMRRVGRHPRYITYARLITAAARAGKRSTVEDILGMACTDVSYLEQYPVVKHGWVSILDSMVAAYLTLGDRTAAAQSHQDLLSMGAAPSANTFGLYITTLKESTRTFDEATEAVKIFHRAIAEGVEPTSFLYNALIGKLGKARRIDDCLQYFAEMRSQNIRPTSVTYGTIVNALCRVSDERFAEEMFDEMESMPNYKPRPAPYNSLIQYFLNTKRDRTKVMTYYERMKSKNIQPTMHTYKLLVDAYASLEPVDMPAAERIIEAIKSSGQQPEAVHYASLIHAKGCVTHDMEGARAIFDSVLSEGRIHPQPCLYQALFEAMVANHQVAGTEQLLKDMTARRVEMTPYIANTLIHGWAAEGNLAKAQAAYEQIGRARREPSTYEAMARAFLFAEDHDAASKVVSEMLSRGYPSAVSGKILELVGGGNTPSISA